MYENFNTVTPMNGLVNYTTISAVQTPTTTQSNSVFHCCNWFGLYNYLVVLFVLLTGLCILLGKVIIKARRRKYRLLQPARLRAQGNGTATCVTPNESASAGTAISTWDNPPTYENAMANYIDAKQQLRAMEEGAVDNAMAMTASTTTIETCITEVAASRTDLSANPAGAINTSNEAPKPMSQ
ncbi:PREDICTED: uncharacterized protein LOC108365068 isoform X1 [Rhagoletis zephyria]|uniref:uncharacterized protein LOC108365068 isoform X1 n=1 Tax=Rhagoletis zephyria TaxID=28612 RepID=UPI00081159D6|nr:PREDICTED: uncharacterized protein LOC108365068 isoform X1 [Rhagoletis zephyria]